MNINLMKTFKQIIAVGLAAAMMITVSIPVTADFAQAADTTYADWIPDLEKFDKSEKMTEK